MVKFFLYKCLIFQYTEVTNASSPMRISLHRETPRNMFMWIWYGPNKVINSIQIRKEKSAHLTAKNYILYLMTTETQDSDRNWISNYIPSMTDNSFCLNEEWYSTCFPPFPQTRKSKMCCTFPEDKNWKHSKQHANNHQHATLAVSKLNQEAIASSASVKYQACFFK